MRRRQELLRPFESAHARRPRCRRPGGRAHRAGALEQPVLARKRSASSLNDSRRSRALNTSNTSISARWRWSVAGRDRMQPVERVREVDEAALVADRRDRLREGHAARDLLPEEEADDLALAVGLDLFAGNDDEGRPRAASTASSAPPKTLWSVTAIAAETDLSAWSRGPPSGSSSRDDQSVCMWRSTTIQSRSASRSASCTNPALASLPREAAVDLVELLPTSNVAPSRVRDRGREPRASPLRRRRARRRCPPRRSRPHTRRPRGRAVPRPRRRTRRSRLRPGPRSAAPGRRTDRACVRSRSTRGIAGQ